jgi:SAM-dependent methyltransferase
MNANRDQITQAVRQKYGQTAASGLNNNAAGVQAVAEAFGYSAQELTSIPAEANMGLSCGNPIATAHLKPGEVVVDLGSGGGLDVFLASAKVGPTGKAIGIDMTPQMLERARKAAAKGNYANVQFLQGSIDNLPLPDASADVIISNCVINLAPDKPAVFREMMRVLKPGGRVAVSDIVIKKPLPEELARDVMAYVGCIAGAIPVSEYEAGLKAAGFQNVVVMDSGRDLNAYSQVEGQSACCSPAPKSPTPTATSGGGCCSGESKASLHVANQPAKSSGGCCSGESKASLHVANQPATSSGGCCSGESDKHNRSGHEVKAGVHEHLSDLMSRYNVNDYAASVKVFALKPH